GSPNARELDAYLGLEYAFSHTRFSKMPKGLQVIPLVSLQYMYLSIQSYKERRAALFNLKVSHQRAKSLRPSLGFRLNQTWDWENVSFSPELIALWQKEFLDK